VFYFAFLAISDLLLLSSFAFLDIAKDFRDCILFCKKPLILTPSHRIRFSGFKKIKEIEPELPQRQKCPCLSVLYPEAHSNRTENTPRNPNQQAAATARAAGQAGREQRRGPLQLPRRVQVPPTRRRPLLLVRRRPRRARSCSACQSARAPSSRSKDSAASAAANAATARSRSSLGRNALPQGWSSELRRSSA
jgi:hypothetical protein